MNSSFYSLRAPVTTVDHAIKLLGLNTVKNLALSFSLIAGFSNRTAKAFNFTRFWKDSLTGAISANCLRKDCSRSWPRMRSFWGFSRT